MGKSHKVQNKWIYILNALNGKIANKKDAAIPENYDHDFFSKISQTTPDTEALNDLEEAVVFQDLINIKSEFRYEVRQTSNFNLGVLEAKVPVKAAKSMILEEIVEDNTYKMKFANGRTEDRGTEDYSKE